MVGGCVILGSGCAATANVFTRSIVPLEESQRITDALGDAVPDDDAVAVDAGDDRSRRVKCCSAAGREDARPGLNVGKNSKGTSRAPSLLHRIGHPPVNSASTRSSASAGSRRRSVPDEDSAGFPSA